MIAENLPPKNDKFYRRQSDIGLEHTISSHPTPLPTNPAQLTLDLGWDKIEKLCSEIVWDQKDWLPRGYVTMLVGESGVGKSYLLLRIAGCYTNGWNWIDGSNFQGERGFVVWCEGEAAQLLNHNRSIQWGLETRKILSPFDDPFIDFNFENENHRIRITELANHPAVRSIIIDSLSGIHHGDENSTAMNATVKFFAELGRNTGKPIIISHHLKKRNSYEKGNITLDDIRGSSSIVQNTRTIWALDQPDPKNDLKSFQVIKSNLSVFPDPIGFQITTEGIECKPLEEPVSIKQLDQAKEFLLDALSSGSILASEVANRAKQKNIAKRTLDTAKKELKVMTKKRNESNGAWVWSLPVSDDP